MKLILKLEDEKHFTPVMIDGKELSEMTAERLWRIFEAMKKSMEKIKQP